MRSHVTGTKWKFSTCAEEPTAISVATTRPKKTWRTPTHWIATRVSKLSYKKRNRKFNFVFISVFSDTFNILNRYKAYIKQRDARFDVYKYLDLPHTASLESIKIELEKKSKHLHSKFTCFATVFDCIAKKRFPFSETSHSNHGENLNKLYLAKSILLHPEKKAAYDSGFKRMIFDEYITHKEFYIKRPF